MYHYNQNIVVDQARRLLFCPIPKVACSNWKITLRRGSGIADYANNDIVHDRQKNGLKYLSDFGRARRALYLHYPRYMRAVFVRNPWTRALSAYRSKIENAAQKIEFGTGNPKTRFIEEAVTGAKAYCRDRNLCEDPNDDNVSFLEFLRYLASLDPHEMNEHWQPQYLVAGLDKVKYQFIGCFENLEGDSRRLCTLTGLPPLYTGPVSVEPTHSSTPRIIERYLNEIAQDLIAHIYRKDIDILGYKPQISTTVVADRAHSDETNR